MVYPNLTSRGPAHRPPDAKVSPVRRELNSRTADGIHVRLLWQPDDGRVLVAVDDTKTGEAFELPVPDRGQALDVFRHPYAYAAASVGDAVALERSPCS